jgi:hypothetical protein
MKLMEWPPRPPDFSPTKKLWEVFCQQVRKNNSSLYNKLGNVIFFRIWRCQNFS